METPKTIVIGIFTHGKILLDENNSPYKQSIPQDKYLNIICGTPPGVSNVSTLSNIETLGEVISEEIDTHSNILNQKNISENTLDFITLDISQKLIENNKENAEEISKIKTKSNTFSEFYHTYDNAFQSIKCSQQEQDQIYNKLYTKFTPDEIADIKNKGENNFDNAVYFNKIIMFNKNNDDLFEIFKFLNNGVPIEEITLFNLLEFMYGFGVENIIIIDLSCSTFSENLTNRTCRLIRREILKKTTGGKYKKTTSRKGYKVKKRSNTPKRKYRK